MADMLQFNNKTSSKPESSNASSKSRRRYSSEEVSSIIRVSLQEEVRKPDNGIDHDELLSIGKEMGVDSEQIDHAIHHLEEDQITKNNEQLLWTRFKAHRLSFIAINLLCLTINLLTDTDYLWFGWVLLGTGISLLGHYAGLRYAPELVKMAMHKTRQGTTRATTSDSGEPYFEDDVNIAFKVGDNSGLMGSEGIIYIDEDRLMIEHQTADTILGVFKTGIKGVEIPLTEIAHAKLSQGFWSSQLIIQGRSLRTFRGMPGANSGKLQLKINKESRIAAELLVAKLQKL